MSEKLEASHPKIARGLVWCRHCGRGPVKVEHGLRDGWPKCCGYTMTIDSPEEQAEFRRLAIKEKPKP